MAWETITPRRGERVTVSRGVTVAWRKANGAAQFSMCLTVVTPVAEVLGWKAKDRVQVQRDLAAGLLRLSPSSGADTYAMHGSTGSGVVAANFSFPGLPLTDRQPARITPHRIEDGALIVTLPAWAVPPAAAPVPPKAPGHRLPATDREASALSLLRSRVETAQVVRETGLSPRDVVRLAEQVRAEREGHAA